MKILVADKLAESTVNALTEMGAKVEIDPGLGADDLPGSIGDAEILIVRSTKVTAQVIDSGTSLSLIIRAGAGVNTIDLEYASSHGVHVANCPGTNTFAVAEIALGHIIAADRRIVSANADLREGRWRKKEYQKARGLKGRTLGIVGFGAIGKAVASRAVGLGMDIIAWSRSLTEEDAGRWNVGYCETPEQLARRADVVSVHIASTPETKHLVGKKFLEAMKDGAIFVNTSRGEVVDTAALKDAVKNKQLRVGLDVFENEPAGGEADFEDRELAEMVTCTPHVGASTDQASEAVGSAVVEIVRSYMSTGKPINTVNVRSESVGACSLVVRHYNHVGVLAWVLDELREQKINIEEMENTIFEGGHAASCTLKLDSVPTDESIQKMEDKDDIIQISVK